MSDPNTLRILEIDGGGERGYLPLSFFLLFLQLWGIDPKSVYKQFDVICGTSIGGILALALALGKDPNDLTSFFTDRGPNVFSITSLYPSIRPGTVLKLAYLLSNTPFYQSSGSRADKYGYGLLVKTLQDLFGNSTLQDVKTNVIIPSYQNDNDTYVTFSNMNYPEFIGQNELVINAALATGSAPVYFPPLRINNHIYIDGGVYNNNPVAIARSMGQAIKPTATRACIVSLGTGQGEKGFDPGRPSVQGALFDQKLMNKVLEPTLINYPDQKSIHTIVPPQVMDTLKVLQPLLKNINLQKNINPGTRFGMNQGLLGGPFDTIAQIFGLFDIASVGGQESASFALSLEARYTINQLYHYRFQPRLDPNLNTELDNTDGAILDYYKNTARQWFNNDIKDISKFLGHLMA